MTIPAIHELDPLDQLKALRATAGDDPLDQLKALQRGPDVRGAAPTDATRALPQSRENATGDYEATAPAVLGTLASPIRHIPFAEGTAAHLRSLVRGQSYSQARNDIRDAVDEAPKALTVPLEMGGAALSAMAIPGSGMRSGFLYGAADALGQSDPDAGLKSRIDQAGIEGTLYGGLGAAGMAAGAVKKLPSGTAGKVWGALLPRNLQRAGRVLSVVRDAGKVAVPKVAPEVAAPAVKAGVPMAEGFVEGNSMDNVLEAVKAREQPSSAALDAVKRGPEPKTNLSTAADRARWRRAGGAPVIRDAPPIAAPTPAPSSLDAQLADLLAKARAEGPAVGNEWSDAEIAMGKHIPEPDLETLLRQSVIRGGGVPRRVP